jgi:hypothetical protein
MVGKVHVKRSLFPEEVAMLKKLILAALVLVALPLASAQGGVRIGIGIGIPIYRPYYGPYYGPYYRPVVVAPAPVYVAQPVVTYVQPAQPVVVAQPQVVVQPTPQAPVLVPR